jgi:drug/metabolite transporter superfamily protein YnfA
MSSSHRTSATLRIGVPLYLLVIGVGLLVGAGWMALYEPDEWFVSILAATGGVTMLATIVVMMTVAKDR